MRGFAPDASLDVQGRGLSKEQVRKRFIRYKDIGESFYFASQGGVQVVAPAAIIAASGVTGSVVRLRPVTPSSLSSTSAVTASVGRGRPVTPAAVNATSSVTASVGRLRPVVPAAITASSDVTAGVADLPASLPSSGVADNLSRDLPFDSFRGLSPDQTRKRAIHYRDFREVPYFAPQIPAGVRAVVPAAISSTSDVTATVVRLRPVAPASIVSTSAITGTVIRLPGAVVPSRPTLTLTTSAHGTLAGSPETRATLSGSTATRGSLGGEQGYGSAIPGNSPWSLPDLMIPDDADTTDWMRDEDDLTPSPSTRATLTPA